MMSWRRCGRGRCGRRLGLRLGLRGRRRRVVYVDHLVHCRDRRKQRLGLDCCWRGVARGQVAELRLDICHPASSQGGEPRCRSSAEREPHEEPGSIAFGRRVRRAALGSSTHRKPAYQQVDLPPVVGKPRAGWATYMTTPAAPRVGIYLTIRTKSRARTCVWRGGLRESERGKKQSKARGKRAARHFRQLAQRCDGLGSGRCRNHTPLWLRRKAHVK